MKKVLPVLFLLLLPMFANAEKVKIDGIWYELLETECARVIPANEGTIYSGDIVIPEIIAYNNIEYYVTVISHRAFDNCTNLTGVYLPKSISIVDVYAFYDCPSLKNIVVEEGNPEYDSRNNCNAIIETSTNTLIIGCKNSIIPNSVTSIGHAAFENCINLTDIVIPNSVTNIGCGTFYGCSSLTNITISNAVAKIEDYTFKKCI